MKTARLTAAAALLLTLTTTAGAQIADQRTFFHGFWSNNVYVAHRQVYPPVWKTGHPIPTRYVFPDLDWNSEGGGVLHERNW